MNIYFDITNIIIAGFVLVNVFAFLAMMIDKLNAVNGNSERISEGMMFFLAAAFGSIGVYAGMFAFRHKTRHWYFLVGMPLLIAENIATLYFLYTLINKI